MANHITELCNGCSACERQCPVEAITKVSERLYRVDPGPCIECNVCGIICPVEAVLDKAGQTIQRLRRDQRARPVVDPQTCNGCELCVELCPFECRSITGRGYDGISLLARPGACVSCGECARHCIKGAIVMTPFNIRNYDPEAEQRRLEWFLGRVE